MGRFGVEKHLGLPGDHPQFRILSDEKLEQVHSTVLEILGTVGIRVAVQETVEMMGDAGCGVDGDMVTIPGEHVERAIATAPKRITIYDRNGEPAMDLGGPEVYCRTGYTPLEFFDLETDERRDYTLDDFRTVARVVDALPNVNAVGQSGVVRPSEENPLEVINHLEVEAMLTNTTKPLHLLVASREILSDCLDMAEAVATANGAHSLEDRPFVLPFLNPISPLLYNDETVEKLLLAVDRGVPVICGPGVMMGATSPMTLAGSIAQGIAETLAGLVISQIRREGAPYVLWAASTDVNMRTGRLSPGPSRFAVDAGYMEMGHYYGLPISGGNLLGTDRGALDGETGVYQGIGSLVRLLARGNAGLGIGAGTSLKECIMANETVGMLKSVMRGVEISEETLAMEAIRDVGAGGGMFLAHPHTYRHFKDRWESALYPAMTYEEWEADGRKSLRDRVNIKLQEILDTHEVPPLPESARRTINEIIARARAAG